MLVASYPSADFRVWGLGFWSFALRLGFGVLGLGFEVLGFAVLG